MTSSTRHRRTSLRITILAHIALVALGLIPFATQQTVQLTEFAIPIEFADDFGDTRMDANSSPEETISENNASTYTEEMTEEILEEEVIDEEMVEDEILTVPEESETAVTETEETVSAEEELSEVQNVENANDGESDGENDGEGIADGGIEGDGVISRRIISRSDISQVAFESGIIVVDVCINRQGRILTAANNSDSTTMTNMDIIREALDLVVDYRFESDYSAAKRECGSLTFIFDVEEDTSSADVRLIASN